MLGSNFLIDTHCHFDFDVFDLDRQSLWQLCQQSNIRQLVIPGFQPIELPKAREICENFHGIFFAAGLHPWWITRKQSETKIETKELAGLLSNYVGHHQCVAIGECGLDRAIDLPLERQLEYFKQHLLIAQQVDKPVIIHNRKANNELLQCLDSFPLARGGVLHGFSGSLQFAKQIFRRGLLLGVGGTITYPRAKKTRAAIAAMPLESLVLETDAPDMPPRGKQGQRNSPENLIGIASCLAELRGITLDEVAAQTTVNAQRLFGI